MSVSNLYYADFCEASEHIRKSYTYSHEAKETASEHRAGQSRAPAAKFDVVPSRCHPSLRAYLSIWIRYALVKSPTNEQIMRFQEYMRSCSHPPKIKAMCFVPWLNKTHKLCAVPNTHCVITWTSFCLLSCAVRFFSKLSRTIHFKILTSTPPPSPTGRQSISKGMRVQRANAKGKQQNISETIIFLKARTGFTLNLSGLEEDVGASCITIIGCVQKRLHCA